MPSPANGFQILSQAYLPLLVVHTRGDRAVGLESPPGVARGTEREKEK